MTVCKDGIAHEMYVCYVCAFVHVLYSFRKELEATGKIIERSNVVSYHIRSSNVISYRITSYHVYCSKCEAARRMMHVISL